MPPIDPVVLRNSQPFDDEPCWVMELNRKNPPYKALRWHLPSRAELA